MVNCNKVEIIQTAKDTDDRLSQKTALFLDKDRPEKISLVEVDAQRGFQEMTGFGGAFTESSAFVFAHMEPEKKEEIIAQVRARCSEAAPLLRAAEWVFADTSLKIVFTGKNILLYRRGID